MTEEKIKKIIKSVEANQMLEGSPAFTEEEKEELRTALASDDPNKALSECIKKQIKRFSSGN